MTSASTPEVSVVLPTYEMGGTIGDAIESVLAQSHGPKELIVVDGGSTDGTEAVLASVDDERLRVVRMDAPDGPSAARNAGVRRARGDLVAFVDADDRWRPEKLARQVAALDRIDAGVALCGITKSFGEPRTRQGASGDVHEAIRRLALPTYTSTLVARRDALESVGGFDESLGCFEDWELCLRLSREYRFAFVDEPLVLKGTGGEHVSADPDRLADAFRRLDGRYDLPAEARATFLADVGMTACEAGRLDDGLPHLLRAIRLRPGRPKVAAAATLAAAGSLVGRPSLYDRGMSRVYDLERAVRTWAPAPSRPTDAWTSSDQRGGVGPRRGGFFPLPEVATPMEVTPPNPGDEDAVADVVGRSLRASYALSPEEIEAVVERWYAADRLAEQTDEPGTRIVVARADDAVLGAAAGRLVAGDLGIVNWIHVDPPERGHGVGTRLFEDLRTELTDAGAEQIRARILASNAEGSTFLKRFGLAHVSQDRVEADVPGSPYLVDVYSDRETLGSAERVELDEIPERATVDDETYRVDQDEVLSGTDGPFLRLHDAGDAGGAAEDGRFVGYYCTSCGTLVKAMDGLDRLVCQQCGNNHREDNWDGAYL